MMSRTWVAVCLMLLSPCALVLGDQTYLCTYGQNERVISVIYQDQLRKLPCEVRYQHDSLTEVLWEARSEQGYCEQKALDFVQQQIAWGWRCDDFATKILQSQPLSSAQIADYQRAAFFAQALAVLNGFKIRILEYYAMQGDYPLRLGDLGLSRAQMRDSTFVSDINLGEKGALYALGGSDLGHDVVIRLAPHQSLGGVSTEWHCTTNLVLNSYMPCDHDASLTFPH